MNRTVNFLIFLFVVLSMSSMPSLSKDTADVSTSDKLSGASTSEKIDILAEEIERLKNQELFGGELGSQRGFGAAASKVYNTSKGLAIGGYGEIVNKAYIEGDKYDQSDAYRGILYVGYKFDDEWTLNTEVEFEHADESYLEFAYIDYAPKATNGKLGARAGLLLLPLGIINEKHEPTLFHGVYRPWTENKIIPTTSRENGVGIFGQLGEKLDYKLYYVTSLKYPGVTKQGAGMRDFRGKGSQTVSNEMATIGRLEYQLTPNMMIGGSWYEGKVNPSSGVTGFEVNDPHTSVQMLSVFTKGEVMDIEYVFLYAENNFSHVQRLNNTLTSAKHLKFGKKQVGYYGEVAHDLGPYIGTSWYVAPFYRYEYLNFHDEIEASAERNIDYRTKYHTTGISVKPIYNIVLKADYTRYLDGARDGDYRALNLGIGYIF